MYQLSFIDDVYPLTIVNTRFGYYVVLNSESDASFVQSIEGDEEVNYDIHNFLRNEVYPLKYGIGKTLIEAILFYKEVSDEVDREFKVNKKEKNDV